ncbi:MAG TPA: hypothetical protein VHC01_03760 [Gaiellaceae bacterium]|nr:hypothetical protein [Gaiellaceae bacterium]
MSATVGQTTAIKDDLAAEIVRRRRKQMPRLTAVLAAAVLVGAGILGGIEIQKHWGSSSGSNAGGRAGLTGANASSIRSALQSRFGGGAGGAATGSTARGGGFGGFGGFGGGASGTVTLVKGSDLYVTESSGNTVLVHTTAGSQVTKTVTGTVRSIHPGDTVSINGSQASNGSWTASRITLTPSTSSSNG